MWSRLELCAQSHNPEVRATYLAEVGTSVFFIGGGIFVNVAILRFANEEAGCVPDESGSFSVSSAQERFAPASCCALAVLSPPLGRLSLRMRRFLPL
jgi:hypothetical protein